MPDREQPAQFWTQVEATCQSLHAHIYLPANIEAHLQSTTLGHQQSPSYPSRLREALRSVEHLFDSDTDACQANKAFTALDNHLATVERQLLSLISSLEQSSAAVRDSAHRRSHLKSDTLFTADEARYISDFLNRVVLPDSVRTVISSSNPHSEDFKNALEALSRALASCDLHSSSPSVQELHRSIVSLRDVAVCRIDERLRESLRLMRDPTSSFMILRDTLLLKQKPLSDFLSFRGCARFNCFVRGYVQIAKFAFRAHMQSYYSLLVPYEAKSDVLVRHFPLVGGSTSKMLSSIWDYASATSHLPETDVDAKIPGVLESPQDKNRKKEASELLSNQCGDAMRQSLSPPLAAAEIRLKGNSLSFPLNRLIRELAASFLSYERSESQFLAAIFEADGHRLLAEIFSDDDNPVLSCVEESIEKAGSRSEPEQLCLSMYVCRRIRESITTHQEVDHRVSFFVLAERIVQTRFLSVLDSRAKATTEAMLQKRSDVITETTAAAGMAQFSSLVSNLLVIAQQGDKWIRSQDVGYALRRRLNSCINMVLTTADNIQGPDNTDYGIRAQLHSSTMLLLALDTCRSLEPLYHGTGELRILLEKSFRRGCNAYARAFEIRSLNEIGELESSMQVLSLDETAAYVSALVNKLNNAESMVKDGMKFLADESVEDVYASEAVKSVLSSLHLRTEALKEKLSVHHSELSAMLDWRR